MSKASDALEINSLVIEKRGKERIEQRGIKEGIYLQQTREREGEKEEIAVNLIDKARREIKSTSIDRTRTKILII